MILPICLKDFSSFHKNTKSFPTKIGILQILSPFVLYYRKCETGIYNKYDFIQTEKKNKAKLKIYWKKGSVRRLFELLV